MKAIVIIACVLTAAPASAQEPTPFRWGSHEQIPARISDGLVAAQLLAAAVHDLRTQDRRDALTRRGCSIALTLLANEGLKRLVHRERPNHRDRKSFPSMHTALAASAADWTPSIGASIAVGVGWGRMASGWHFGSDVAIGAGLGLVSHRICHTGRE